VVKERRNHTKMVTGWKVALQAVHERIGERFKGAESRQRVYRYFQGLLSDIRRKNGWQRANSAIAVDASSAHLQADRQEAKRQGHEHRITYPYGGFGAIAPQLPHTDIVTLEKVICCYPDMETLVDLSSARADNLYGGVFHRDTWWMHVASWFINLFPRLQRSAFRFFVHPTEAVEAVVQANGLERRYYHETLLWQVIVYVSWDKPSCKKPTRV
jgi:hypothetical protein